MQKPEQSPKRARQLLLRGRELPLRLPAPLASTVQCLVTLLVRVVVELGVELIPCGCLQPVVPFLVLIRGDVVGHILQGLLKQDRQLDMISNFMKCRMEHECRAH